MLIGLDCAEPSLVLERWRDELPTISGLMERGAYGRLTSVIPPITVPAWSCMMSSKTPGDLGVYGFRNRADHTYDGNFIAMGDAIREPRLWDYVTRAGGSSIVLSVPGTFPPRPLNGVMVGCFLTPSVESKYTYPAALKDEIAEVVGEYLFDTKDFRTDDKEYLLRQVYEMTDRRFRLAEHLLETKPWTLFAMVEMGPDRMHHGFWKFMDPEHRKHEAGNAYENAILDYHRHVDGLIAKLLEHADDDTVVFVLSDHGAKRLDGGIRINEWLRQEGLLATLAEPDGVSSLRDVGVDWSRTTAWGEGGYYARVFLNVQGREPEGTIPPEQYEAVRADLARRIAADPRRRGEPDPDRRLHARGAVRRAAGRRARPHRRLRRPPLALGRHDRRRRGHPDARERHGARRREPRAGRSLRRRRARDRRVGPPRCSPPGHHPHRARAPRHRRAARNARREPPHDTRSRLGHPLALRRTFPVGRAPSDASPIIDRPWQPKPPWSKRIFRLSDVELALLIFGIVLGATLLGTLVGRRLRGHADTLKEPFGVLQAALLGSRRAHPRVRHDDGRRALRRPPRCPRRRHERDRNHLPARPDPARAAPHGLARAAQAVHGRRNRLCGEAVPGSAAYRAALDRAELRQRELWRLGGDALAESPQDSAPRLYVETLNEMIDMQTVRVSALNNRVPSPVLFVTIMGAAVGLGLLALYLAMLSRGVVTVILAAVFVSVLVYMTFDLDRPARGFVQVPDTPLVDLRASMELPPAAAGPG